MKIKPQHYEVMRESMTVEPLNPAPYIAAGLSHKRYRWDSASHAGLMPYMCDVLYVYLNDEHIDTALRSILGDTYSAAF